MTHYFFPLLPAALLCLLPAAAPSALACRYSVRDTGFVDLGAEPYRLILHFSPSSPSQLKADFEQSAAAVLLDANIAFSSQPAEAGAPARLILLGPDQRELPLGGDNDPDVATNRPSVGAGVSPGGQNAKSLPVGGATRKPALPTSRAGIVDLLERAVTSPARIRLHDELLRAHAVLVLVEGQDTDANRRARQTLDEAVAAITRLLPEMPKPVDVPPRILAIPAKSVVAESVLVWGLGMQPQPTRDPRVAVVFGRGRRVGEPLEGGLITRTTLQDRLAIIGQDCECDLDRSSLQGPVIPARWDSDRQRAAAAALGFDPENPLIRAEISRIVLKGPLQPGARRTTSGAFDALALGYSEEPIETAAASTPVETAEDPPAPVAKRTPPGPSSADGPARSGGVFAVWIAVSGFGMVIALAGAWLLGRSRKDPS